MTPRGFGQLLKLYGPQLDTQAFVEFTEAINKFLGFSL